MDFRPRRFAGPIAGTGAAAVLFQAAGRPLVVRCLQVCNTTTSQQTFHLSIGADAAGTRLFDDFAVPADSILNLSDEYFVLDGSDTMEWTAPTSLTISVFGDEVH